jgi:hypothetical protein
MVTEYGRARQSLRRRGAPNPERANAASKRLASQSPSHHSARASEQLDRATSWQQATTKRARRAHPHLDAEGWAEARPHFVTINPKANSYSAAFA